MAENRITLSDFSKGVLSRGVNHLDFPSDGLVGGLNVDISHGLKVREGCSIVSDGSLPVGTIKAMKQARFPTNGDSKIICQVEYAPQWIERADSLYARSDHSTIWDPVRGRLVVFGGLDDNDFPLNDILTFSTSSGWSTIEPIGDAPLPRFGHIAFYDPLLDAMWIVLGSQMTDVWKFDFETETWEEQVCSGTPPEQYRGVFRSTDRSVAIYTDGYYGADHYARLDLATLVWSSVATTYTGQTTDYPYENNMVVRCTYDEDNDRMIVFGGGYESASLYPAILDFSTASWTLGTIFPDEEGLYGYGSVCCSSKVIMSGGNTFLGGSAGDAGTLSVYDVVANEWTTNIPQGAISDRFDHTLTKTDTGALFVYAGRAGGTYAYLSDIYELSANLCNGTVGGANDLYASPDTLPGTTLEFTEIYELGEGAGTVSIKQLNDRVVITEGINERPLVWGGPMSTDATDWNVPKAVLSTQDGENYYDISAEVCDQDTDTVADAGQITANGHIDICCDMPKVSAFYFEMETANTAEGVSAIYSNAETFEDEGTVEQHDLKNTITQWVQDLGLTGHFTDGVNPVTIGPGNTCPDVVVGTRVVFSDNDVAYIQVITDDGEATGEVTLTLEKVTTNVSHVYGTDIVDEKLTVACTYGDLETTSFAELTPTSFAAYNSQFSIRQVLLGADIDYSLDTIQIVLNAINAQLSYLQNAGIVLTGVSIVPRSGSTQNGTTTPTAITFPTGYRRFTLQGVTNVVDVALWIAKPLGGVNALGPATSEKIAFPLTAGVDHLLILDFLDVTRDGIYQNYRNVTAVDTSGSHGGYYVCSGATATLQNATVVSDYTGTGHVIALSKIFGSVESAAPQVIEVAVTSDNAHIVMSGIESIEGIAIQDETAGSSAAYYALSFDGRSTFKIFYADAWVTIAKSDAGTWKYWDGATYIAASTNNKYQALRQAFAVAANQMDADAIAAIEAENLNDADAFIANVTQFIDLACGLLADGNNVLPAVISWSTGVNISSTTAISGFQDGAYTPGDGWTDGTALAGITLAQTGIMAYDGATAFEADYSVLNGVPGFWYRVNMNGTSAGTAITRILYKGPCQPLANIGDGQPNTLNGFIFYDTSKNKLRDYTTDVSDNTISSLSVAEIPMATDDYLYVGYYDQFNAVELTPGDEINEVVSTLSGEYWNGTAWTAFTIVDGTASSSGATLSGKGKVTWDIPTDWKRNIPFEAFLSRAYWVRFAVSVGLTSTATIAECRVYSVPPALKKHKYAEALDNRVILGNRTDAPNQIDISREFEEYGFCGDDSASYNVGGLDQIIGMNQAWNALFLWQAERVVQVSKDGDSFSFQSVEAARHTPVCAQAVAKASTQGKSGLFILSINGVFGMAGLHTDASWNTAQISELSTMLNYWDSQVNPRIDLDYIHGACVEFYAKKNWLCLSVPMILDDATEQTTNNVLLVYDLSIGAWYPMFQFPFGIASMCTAFTSNTNAPGNLGDQILLAGDYEGRVIRLFDPDATTDLGTAIDWSAETGWLHFGDASEEKNLADVWLFGNATGGVTLTTRSRHNYRQALKEPADIVRVFTDLDGVTDQLGTSSKVSAKRDKGNYFKLELSGSGPAEIYGATLGLLSEREK